MRVKLKSRQLTLCLSLVLIVKASRGLAQEDYAGYRHQFYGEDDHRMKIQTDAAAFDVGLGSHARLNGDFVLDTISGATPTGAPPQSKWPFPSYASYYNQAYNNFLQIAVTDPINVGYLTSGLLGLNTNDPVTLRAYTNFVISITPQLATQATNSANSSYQALTNNPNYRNRTKVPLVELHDLRRAFSLGSPLTFGIHTITPQVSISEETDYHAYGMALNYAVDLNKKNTTLNFGWAHDADLVRDANFFWQRKVTDDFLIGVNQLLTPKSYLTVNFTYGQEYGYLSDPYRGVMTILNFPQLDPDDAALIAENRPRRRTKEIVYTSYTQFIDRLEGSAEVGYRFYHDSYGTFAQTAELAWHQKLGRRLVFTPSFRYYYQTAANFYSVIFPDYNNLPAYYSSDYRLSQLESFTFSAALSYRICKCFSLDAGYSRYKMQGLDGVTSPSAYPAANIYTFGGRIWF